MAFEGTLQEFTVSMHGHTLEYPFIEAQQGDTASRKVRIHLKTFGGADFLIPYGATAVLSVTKTDGYKILNECEIEDSSTVVITLTSQTLACPGKQLSQIYIFADKWDIKTQKFYIHAPKAEYSDDAVQSADEYGILQDLIERAKKLEDGVTFTPHVAEDGTLSWSNDGGLDNPESVNIMGPEGPKGDKGDAGPQGPEGPKGDPGENGSDASVTEANITAALGYTPANNKDVEKLNTDLDKLEEELTEYVDSEITDLKAQGVQQTPLFANSIGECTDTSKVYVLPDGYIYGYIEAEGCVNWIPLSTTEDDTTIFNGVGYQSGVRIGSSGTQSNATMCLTGYIPYTPGQIIRIKNIEVYGSDSPYLVGYDADKTFITVYAFATYFTQGSDGVWTGSRDTSNLAYIRLSVGTIDDTSILTLDEEITDTVGSGYAWRSTGHAFVPADYEERILTLESATAELKEELENIGTSDSDAIPDYVIEEADGVIDRVLQAQGTRTFNALIMGDFHNNGGVSDVNIMHACQGANYVANRIKIDTFISLGDHTDSTGVASWAECQADIKACNSHKRKWLGNVDILEVPGNHDYKEPHSPMTYKMISAFSKNVVWGSMLGGYFYKDYEEYNLRIIGLNTSETEACGVSDEQYNWFIQCLDLSSKSDASNWQVLILSHIPLDWMYGFTRFSYILKAYLNGTNWTDGTISCDFANKNQAKIIANVHGHVHNFLVDRLYLGYSSTSTEQIDVYRIAMPEVTESYQNHYDAPFKCDTTYPKTNGTAEDTSFSVLCIDLDTCTVKAICYGAGIDREISY